MTGKTSRGPRVFRKITGWILLNDPEWSEEKKREYVLLRRLDLFFCSYMCLSAIIKYLDQNNISNAYVSGMKEELGLYGKEYNLFTTYFNIAYFIVIPFSNYFINDWIRPSLWLPTAEIIWGISTACVAAAKDTKAVYGLRFLIGFAEGTAWPSAMVLFLSWYTPAEIGKRLAAYSLAGSIGALMAGSLQAALYTNLNGSHGLSGWRWMFVVNAGITFAVASWGFVACPDYPNKPNPWSHWWLRPVDIEAAQLRMNKQKRKLPTGWNLQKLKSTVTRPQNVAIWVLYTMQAQGGTGKGYFNLWLKSLKNANGTAKYSVTQLNLIPVGTELVSIFATYLFLSSSDYYRIQWPFIVIALFFGLIFASILAAWNVPDTAKFVSFFFLIIPSVNTSLIIAWLGTLVKHSAEERSFVVAANVVTYYAITAGMPLSVWPASEAPHYRIGWNYAVAMYAAAIPTVFVVVWLQRRQERIDAKNDLADPSRTLDSPVIEDDKSSGNIEDSASPEATETLFVPGTGASHIVPTIAQGQSLREHRN